MDVAGNVSAPSASYTFTVVTNGPAAPSTPSLLAADDSGTVGDGITNDNDPALIGTASAAGLTIQLINASNTVIGTATSGTGGAYSVTPTTALADGTYVLRVQAVNSAGLVSAPSGSFTLQILTVPPAAPSTPTLLAADDSGVVGDDITNDTTPSLIGTAEPGSTVIILNPANTIIGFATTAASGADSVAPSLALTNGTYVFRVEAVDVAGNIGQPSGSITLTIDTTPPAAPSTPSLLAADQTGTGGAGTTTVAQPTLVGTGIAGDTIQLLNASGSVIGTGVVASNGTYSVQLTNPLSLGTYAITAVAEDVAGNFSTPSAAFSLTIQAATVVVPTPSTPSLLPADDSGVLGDGITNDNKPALIGTAAVGTTVQILNSAGTVLASAATSASGTYSVQLTSTLADGTYGLQARAVNSSGIFSARARPSP